MRRCMRCRGSITRICGQGLIFWRWGAWRMRLWCAGFIPEWFVKNFTHPYWRRARYVGSISGTPHKNAGWQPAIRLARGDVGSISASPYKRAGRDASGTKCAVPSFVSDYKFVTGWERLGLRCASVRAYISLCRLAIDTWRSRHLCLSATGRGIW